MGGDKQIVGLFTFSHFKQPFHQIRLCGREEIGLWFFEEDVAMVNIYIIII